MSIAVEGSGLLPPGRHRATLGETRALFVDGAPFSTHRALLWDTFLLYRGMVAALMPSARFWVNGGFVTHKMWAAPKDIDVCLVAPVAEIEQAGDHLDPLLTDTTHGRRQPMGGLIDGFLAAQGMSDDIAYWSWEWSRVRDERGDEVPGARKGYVEVIGP